MSVIPDLSRAEWAKSSYSGNGGGNCVEWAPAYAGADVVPVRDSKELNGTALLFTTTGWGDFVSALRRGDLTG